MTVAPAISTELAAVSPEAVQPGWWRRLPAKAKAGVVLFGLFVLATVIPLQRSLAAGATATAPEGTGRT